MIFLFIIMGDLVCEVCFIKEIKRNLRKAVIIVENVLVNMLCVQNAELHIIQPSSQNKILKK